MISDRHLLNDKKRLHFIGIGGSGMYPIVQILHSRGYIITGSDVLEGDTVNYERALGIDVYIGHKAENVHGADLIVYTAALLPGNPEMEEAEMLGIPCVERSVILGYITSLFPHSICISGTHGKTTTTSMVTQVLTMAGKDAAAVIGGKLPLINGYGKDGSGNNIVVEACEFSDTFLHLEPYISVVLNIDKDHMDYFKTLDNLKASFRKFIDQTLGFVIVNGDDENTMSILSSGEDNVLTFGLSENCTFRAVNVQEYRPSFYSFDVETDENGNCGTIYLSVPGNHNVSNALAAFVSCFTAGCTFEEIAEGLNAFRGAGRRFEILGEVNGVTIADDYAHHPTELTVTLEAAKKMDYNNVWAVFQPFTYSRTKLLLNEFAEALKIADNVVMTEIMGSREVNTIGIYTKDLAELVPNSVWFNTFEEVVEYTMQHAKPKDLVLTLGCGDIYKAAKMMLSYNNID